MKRGLRDIPGLLRTSVGRAQIRGGLLHRSWPVTSRLAAVYRKTVVRRTRIVTVVGSYGKTTTSLAVVAALGCLVRRPLPGNHKEAALRAIFLLRPSDRLGVMEIGIAGKGQMAPIAKTIRPDVAVVTTIGSEHHRSLKTLETTRDEKAHMVRKLPRNGLAVLNGDDPNVLWMATQTQARIVTYGLGQANQVRASHVQLDWPRGMRFFLHVHGDSYPLRIRLIGRHMIYPVLAAAAVALAEGCPLDECAKRLAGLDPTPGRMEVKRLTNGAILICDYFKSPYETILTALDTLAEIPARRRIVVLGDVSEPPARQRMIYRELGRRVARMASQAIFVSQKYRIYKVGATRTGLPASDVLDAHHHVLDAAKILRNDLGAGDVVLIKGRSTQRLDRIALALTGRDVGCNIRICRLKGVRCHNCPMLEKGWGDLAVVT